MYIIGHLSTVKHKHNLSIITNLLEHENIHKLLIEFSLKVEIRIPLIVWVVKKTLNLHFFDFILI